MASSFTFWLSTTPHMPSTSLQSPPSSQSHSATPYKSPPPFSVHLPLLNLQPLHGMPLPPPNVKVLRPSTHLPTVHASSHPLSLCHLWVAGVLHPPIITTPHRSPTSQLRLLFFFFWFRFGSAILMAPYSLSYLHIFMHVFCYGIVRLKLPVLYLGFFLVVNNNYIFSPKRWCWFWPKFLLLIMVMEKQARMLCTLLWYIWASLDI